MVENDKLTLLGNVLQSHGVLSTSQVREAVWKQKDCGKLFGEMLQELGMATSSQVKAALLDQKYRRRNRIEPPSIAP